MSTQYGHLPDTSVGDYLLEWFASFSPEAQERIQAHIEQLEEREALSDTGPHSEAYIAELEAKARQALDRAESFEGEHAIAEQVLAIDIPRYRSKIHRWEKIG